MFQSILTQSLKTIADLAVMLVRVVLRKRVEGVVELAVPAVVEETPIVQAADLVTLKRNCETNG